MKKTLTALSLAAVVLCVACNKNNSLLQPPLIAQDDLPMPSAGSVISWITGTLPATSANPANLIVPNSGLCNLSVTKAGSPIYVSNNPEIYTGNGWLMQNARTDASRGGRKFPLKGSHVLYLFHINQSGGTRFMHVLASNPRPNAISVAYKGACYTNASKPLTGSGTGPCYAVAKDWLNHKAPTSPTALPINGNTGSFPQFGVRELFKIQMNSLNMVDGRFEVNASDSAIYYVVVTSTGNLTDAITASQGTFASGPYFPEVTNDFGREAGVYATNEVTATNNITLPASASYIGFSLNTTNKFFPVENQTSPALMTMSQAASQSYGNYGHYYRVVCNITNSGTTSRNVKMYFASNVTGTGSNATWNGPVRNNGTVFDVYTTLSNPRQQLASWTINPGTFVHTLEFFVPGLITTNQQIIYQVN
jgi:hypothetical protein